MSKGLGAFGTEATDQGRCMLLLLLLLLALGEEPGDRGGDFRSVTMFWGAWRIQTRLRRLQWPHTGCVSSHFFLLPLQCQPRLREGRTSDGVTLDLRRHVRQPVRCRVFPDESVGRLLIKLAWFPAIRTARFAGLGWAGLLWCWFWTPKDPGFRRADSLK
jgi:hypothetical protein